MSETEKATGIKEEVKIVEEPILEKEVKKEQPKEEKPKKIPKKNAPHISEEKKEEVSKITELLNQYPTLALIDLLDLPSAQLQVMRKKLGEDTLVRVTKKRLIKKALEKCKDKKNIEDLNSHLDKIVPAILFSKQNAFKLSSFLRKNKTKVAAKPGQLAPRDITINAGPTPFTPGPIIGELGAMGLKATVEEGKIVIKEDAVVVKEGEEIQANVADLLVKLDIKPMELGLNLAAAYEEGLVLDKKVLDFNEEEYLDQIKQIASDAFNLTVGIGYVTEDNIQLLLGKAEREVKALIDAAGILTSENVGKVLSKAENEADNVKKLVKDVPEEQPSLEKNVDEEKKEEPKEEKKEEPKEEKKEEPKVEEKTEDLKEEMKEEKPEEDKMVDIVEEPKSEEKKEDVVPTAEELAKKKEEKLSEKPSPKDEVPSAQDLVEKSKKETKKEEDVPKIHDLVEKKDTKEEN
jgi:large subunit ribosomal protein L10